MESTCVHAKLWRWLGKNTAESEEYCTRTWCSAQARVREELWLLSRGAKQKHYCRRAL